MPPFSKGQDSNQWVVHGNIAGFEFLVAPDVTNGVYTPGYVPRDDGTEGVTPAHGWETS